MINLILVTFFCLLGICNSVYCQNPIKRNSDKDKIEIQRPNSTNKANYSRNNSNTTSNIKVSFSKGILQVDNIIYPMIYVEAGTLIMGVHEGQRNEYDKDEIPVHKETVRNGFFMGKTEVTQELWQTVMGNNPSKFKGERNPVEEISWNDCKKFIARLNSLTGLRFRLPSEIEWEYAARGGNMSKGYYYSGSNNANDVAWYGEHAFQGSTHSVAQKKANELGFYDMSGNVSEWCENRYDDASEDRVVRGGGYYHIHDICSCSTRRGWKPDVKDSSIGVRLVVSE